ncbi:MAG: Transcription-repair-coupling factor [bacterium ADurb.Bin212]|nr:MAG: Transcription-repair-coupling factor [bacterium ADurb.Bin212]
MSIVTIKIDQAIKPSYMQKMLDDFCYERVNEVDSWGSYSVSGGNIILYAVNYKEPYLIEFLGDNIDRIINLNSRRAMEALDIAPNCLKTSDGATIRPDDYIVHIDHGIGLFKGVVVKENQNKRLQYLKISFLNDDLLYLPLELSHKITKYIGVGKKPRLNRLGSSAWERVKKRAYESAIILARDLLAVYAKRELTKKSPYKIDFDWDSEIRKTFIHNETEDQTKAIKEVYTDLAKNKPMDRLVVGDVGFGKTEVALRAVVQTVANSHQALIISPTTILAQQHYTNITSRVKHLPIRTALISRMTAQKEQEALLQNIALGKIDLVIATHKIFSSRVKFKNLDLLVIDEEQKFGVKQKDYFKKMRTEINVLSLSATPIPRTLFMSLSGIRDISQISLPPLGRKPIISEAKQYSEDEVKKYIHRELKRGGQVYYLYNDVKSMAAFASNLQRLVPEAKIAYAHGQLPADQLSKVMQDFVDKRYQILVCSTIIENGLDLPNVNTLIIDKADNYGLSQLYQLRGRIGRGEAQAYCLLNFRGEKISTQAFKRIRALMDSSTLGTGFNIALSDLEIRGGGNILGREQHGNMESVGLVLYSQLLNSAVNRIKSNLKE